MKTFTVCVEANKKLLSCVLVASSLPFSGCSMFEPRVAIPPTVEEVVEQNKDIPCNKDPKIFSTHEDRRPMLFIRKEEKMYMRGRICKDYAEYVKNNDHCINADNDAEQSKIKLNAARHRARCLQSELGRHLTNIEDLEIITRAALLGLATVGTAVSFYDAHNDVLGGIGILSGLVAGIRIFHPLEPRQVLYFRAIAGLECAIMAAESVSEKNFNDLFKETLSPLAKLEAVESVSEKNFNDLFKKALSSLTEPEAESISKENFDALKENFNASFKEALSSLAEPENGALANTLNTHMGLTGSPSITSLASSININESNALSNALLISTAQLGQANRAFVNSLVNTYSNAQLASKNAAKDLEDATTLIGLAVNAAIVAETSDPTGVVSSSREATSQFFNQIQQSVSDLRTFEVKSQAASMSANNVADAVLTEIEKMAADKVNEAEAALKQAQPSERAEKQKEKENIEKQIKQLKSNLKKLKERQKEASNTHAILVNIVKQLDNYSKYPKACHALLGSGKIGNGE